MQQKSLSSGLVRDPSAYPSLKTSGCGHLGGGSSGQQLTAWNLRGYEDSQKQTKGPV